MKTFGSTLIAILVALPMAQAADNVDQALKGRDLSTIMSMLKKDGEADPEPVVKASPPAAPVISTHPAPPEPIKAPAQLQQYSDDDLQAIRAKLAAELRSARAEAQKAGLDLETKAAAAGVSVDSSSKPSAALLKDLGKAAPVAMPARPAMPARQVTPVETPSASPVAAAPSYVGRPIAARPEPKPEPKQIATATQRKRASLFSRVFGGRDTIKAAPTPFATPTPVVTKDVKSGVISSTPKTVDAKAAIQSLKAEPVAAPEPIQLAQANLNPIKIEAPKAPSALPARLTTPAPTAVQPAPAIRVAQPAPDVRGMANGGQNVRNNRQALDNLVKQSRADIVKMAMNQASGKASAPVEEVDPNAWKKAGPNAWKYDGEWKDGSMHGQGRMQFADGWEYAGAFVNGNMHGQGTLVYPDTTVYEGQFKNGKMDGFGKLTYPDGWSFVGTWRDGQISGSGTLVNPGN
ncbi:MAG: hypothetical protein ACI9QL_003281 [Candidatus Omnitrophota bacterium]|jgi:hypothetical protein